MIGHNGGSWLNDAVSAGGKFVGAMGKVVQAVAHIPSAFVSTPGLKKK